MVTSLYASLVLLYGGFCIFLTREVGSQKKIFELENADKKVCFLPYITIGGEVYGTHVCPA